MKYGDDPLKEFLDRNVNYEDFVDPRDAHDATELYDQFRAEFDLPERVAYRRKITERRDAVANAEAAWFLKVLSSVDRISALATKYGFCEEDCRKEINHRVVEYLMGQVESRNAALFRSVGNELDPQVSLEKAVDLQFGVTNRLRMLLAYYTVPRWWYDPAGDQPFALPTKEQVRRRYAEQTGEDPDGKRVGERCRRGFIDLGLSGLPEAESGPRPEPDSCGEADGESGGGERVEPGQSLT